MRRLSFFSRAGSKGFTVIELLIVIGVIGLLATIGSISYVGVTKSARDKTVLSDMEGIEAAETSNGLKTGGTYIAWYSPNGINSTLRVQPSTGNIIDVVVAQGAYCIRIYNTGSKYGTIHTAAKQGSSPTSCTTLTPSSTAISQSPPAP